MADFGEILRNNLRAERHREPMTQEQLSERTGIKAARISDLETGRVQLLAEELPALCRALGVPLERLLLGADRADRDALGL